MPRLLALTLVWLLATAALTYAASQKAGTAPTTRTTAATTTAAAPTTLVVPDVRHQPFVFAKGLLGDSGFAWKVVGAVHGYPSNTVVSQTPAPGTEVVDTGAPTITLHLSLAGAQTGVPEDVAEGATAIRLADLSVATVPAARTSTTAKAKPAAAAPTRAAAPATKPKSSKQAPRWPQHRPAAFVTAGARREPLDEMPLTDRAQALRRWLAGHPKPTDANVSHWLYQQAWIVAGARMGWWHGETALRELIAADQDVWDLWGIGARSRAEAQAALAQVSARS